MKPTKADQSGFCRHSKLHHLCHHYFETPKAILVCDCGCHTRDEVTRQKGRVVKAKGVVAKGRVIAPKK